MLQPSFSKEHTYQRDGIFLQMISNVFFFPLRLAMPLRVNFCTCSAHTSSGLKQITYIYIYTASSSSLLTIIVDHHHHHHHHHQVYPSILDLKGNHFPFGKHWASATPRSEVLWPQDWPLASWEMPALPGESWCHPTWLGNLWRSIIVMARNTSYKYLKHLKTPFAECIIPLITSYSQ